MRAMTTAEILPPTGGHTVIDYTPVFIDQILSTIGGHFDRHQTGHFELAAAIARIEKRLDVITSIMAAPAMVDAPPSLPESSPPRREGGVTAEA